MWSTRDPPQNKDTNRLKAKGRKRYFMQMENKRKQEQQYSCQIKQTEIKAMKRDKEGHYIIIKGSIQEEDITIINIYAPTQEHHNKANANKYERGT